nr:Protein F38A5.6 [Haemonchus contortus]
MGVISGFNFRRRFLFKIKEKVGNVEETQMTPEFNHDMQRYDTYHDSVLKLVNLLEAANQPDPTVLSTGRVECPKDEDPLDKVRKALEAFQQFLPPDKAEKVVKICGILEKAANCKRDYQIKKRACIRHLRRFDSLEYKTLVENREQFNKAKSNMDMAKHDVKQAKNTEQIERRAVLYQQTVEVFDEHCNKLIKLLEELPSIKESHSKDLNELTRCSREYHLAMAAIFK